MQSLISNSDDKITAFLRDMQVLIPGKVSRLTYS